MTNPEMLTDTSPFDHRVLTRPRRLFRIAFPFLVVAGSLLAAIVLTRDVPDGQLRNTFMRPQAPRPPRRSPSTPRVHDGSA
jgi:hypothetical protein